MKYFTVVLAFLYALNVFSEDNRYYEGLKKTDRIKQQAGLGPVPILETKSGIISICCGYVYSYKKKPMDPTGQNPLLGRDSHWKMDATFYSTNTNLCPHGDSLLDNYAFLHTDKNTFAQKWLFTSGCTIDPGAARTTKSRVICGMTTDTNVVYLLVFESLAGRFQEGVFKVLGLDAEFASVSCNIEIPFDSKHRLMQGLLEIIKGPSNDDRRCFLGDLAIRLENGHLIVFDSAFRTPEVNCELQRK
jgi:hypothetical protein